MGELERARLLVRDAGAEFADTPAVAARLAECARRLDEPLRVALAGTLKSGKSTLLNALVGEEIAPTDATECTRVVTWFSRAAGPRIELTHGPDGRHTALPVRRRDGRLLLELDGVPAAQVRRLEVGWPSALLQRYTLIDTPGTSSNTRDVSERTLAFLTPPGAACQADAIVYLMRSRQDADLDLLRRIAEHHGALGGPLGVIGVLSRADEIGGAGDGAAAGGDGPGDGLSAARRVTAQLRADPDLAGLHRDFLAVSGLLALRGRTLRQHEFAALAGLAALPEDVRRAALLSPGRFVRSGSAADGPVAGGSADDRQRLLDAFGMIGIKVAVGLIERGARDAPALADALVAHSGLTELAHILDARFGSRHGQLKAHAALRELRAVLAGQSPRRVSRLLRAADHLLADSHALTELRVLAGLDALELDPPELDALERVLGGGGTSAATRFGLPPDAAPADLRAAAVRALSYWHAQLAEPMLDAATARAYRAAVRSCEAALTTGTR